MKIKETRKFNSTEEFYNHLFNALNNDKLCQFIEAYDEQTEVTDYEIEEEDEVDMTLYFLQDGITIQQIAIMLMTMYGSDLCMKIDNELAIESETPVELEDGTKIYQKSLEAFLYPECEHGFTW